MVPSIDPLVVVASILSIEDHPNADSLSCCRVEIGSKSTSLADDQVLSIVCGASNLRVGMKVALAKVGASLQGSPTVIEKTQVRGVVSNGMLCSEEELGLSDSNDGIVELDSQWLPGQSLSQYVGESDVIFKLSVTPNRSDCLSHIGVARELAARYKLSLGEIPLLSFSPLEKKLLDSDVNYSIHVADEVGCARFFMLVVSGPFPPSSPLWLKARLKSCGMRSVSLIVDVTNYVTLELGQPVHAYDLDKLEGQKLTVRYGKPGETFETLDQRSLQLHWQDLVVCDGAKPVSLAGIMGGSAAQVTDKTTKVVFEIAHFDCVEIRKTAKRHGYISEASRRFERKVDISNIGKVAQRVFSLLHYCVDDFQKNYDKKATVEILGAAEYYPRPVQLKKIALRLSRARSVLGLPMLAMKTCIDHLESLGLKLADSTDERMLFEVPIARHDLDREVDLIEEVARLIGYDNISSSDFSVKLSVPLEHPFLAFNDYIRSAMAQYGLHESVTYPFHRLADYHRLGLSEKHLVWPRLQLVNPISEESSWLAASLLPSHLNVISRNRNHGVQGARIFEIGRVFFPFDDNENPDKIGRLEHLKTQGIFFSQRAKNEQRPREVPLLSGVLDAPFIEKSWEHSDISPSFFHGKAIVERLLAGLGIKKPLWRSIEQTDYPWLHPRCSGCVLVNEITIGCVGELHPQVSRNWGLGQNLPVVFEIYLGELFRNISRDKIQVETVSKFPPVKRDLALVVDTSVTYGMMRDVILDCPAGQHLKSLSLFDLYEGEGIEKGKKSLGLSLQFSADKKTLTDKVVEKELNGIISWVQDKVGASLR